MDSLLADAKFWTALSTLIFIALIWKPVGSALITALDGRSAKIQSELDNAKTLLSEAQALLAQYERNQDEMRQLAEATLAQAKIEAEKIRQRAEEELTIALKDRERHALDRIQQAEANAVTEVKNQTISLAIAAARRVIADNLDDQKAGALLVAASDTIARDLSRVARA